MSKITSKVKVAFTKAARKFHVAFSAAVGVAATLATDGLDKRDALAIAIVFFGSLGVFSVKNIRDAAKHLPE